MTEPTVGDRSTTAGPPRKAGRLRLGRRGDLAASLVATAVLVGGGVAAAHAIGAADLSGDGFPGGFARGGIAGAAPSMGTVSRIDATSISVRLGGGETRTYAIAPDTRVERDGSPVAATALTVGESVLVVGTEPSEAGPTANSTATAARIVAGTFR